eukprot:TRINITY_DN1341_c0_g1_i2.p1 TRINITY_DN1341_c0_g1~~TRINITY_DN1341_c0_g1_i2.p1  ORF type:complete len:161 (+),score=44.17 TRINITY_DN1341_c0_g1_i2:3-485(+)
MFFFSSRRRHTRQESVSWARRCVQETAVGFLFGREMISFILLGALISGLNISLVQTNVSGVMNSVSHLAATYQLADEEGKIVTEGSEAQKSAYSGLYYSFSFRETGGRSFLTFYKTICLLCLVCLLFFDSFSLLAKPLGLHTPEAAKKLHFLAQSTVHKS